MTRKRFKKLCMGRSNMDRNMAESICKEFGYNSNMPYERLFRTFFSAHSGIKSKKQAGYFGKPYLDNHDVAIIERYVEEYKKLDLPLQENDCIKQIKRHLEQVFLKSGTWNYGLVAEIITDVLSGKTDIETVRKSVRVMPWENGNE